MFAFTLSDSESIGRTASFGGYIRRFVFLIDTVLESIKFCDHSSQFFIDIIFMYR